MSQRGPPRRGRRGRKNSSESTNDPTCPTGNSPEQTLANSPPQDSAFPTSSALAPAFIPHLYAAAASSNPRNPSDMSQFQHSAQYRPPSETQQSMSTALEALDDIVGSPFRTKLGDYPLQRSPSTSFAPTAALLSNANFHMSYRQGNEYDYVTGGSRRYQHVFGDTNTATASSPSAIDKNQNYNPHSPRPLPDTTQTGSTYPIAEYGPPTASVAVSMLASTRVWKPFKAELNSAYKEPTIHPACLKKLHLVPKDFPYEGYISNSSGPTKHLSINQYVEIAVQLSDPEIPPKSVRALVLPDDVPCYDYVCLWLGSKFIDEVNVKDWVQKYHNDHVQNQLAVLSYKTAPTLSFGEIIPNDASYQIHHASSAGGSNIPPMFSPGKLLFSNFPKCQPLTTIHRAL